MGLARKIFLLALWSSWLTGRVALAADVYGYDVAAFPKSEAPAGCRAAAESVASRLAAETGVRIYRAECAGETAEAYRLRIQYIADAPLPLVSGAPGAYRDYASCRGDLERQNRLFRESVKLVPFLSYCRRLSELEELPFVLVVDAFGRPAARPLVFEATVFGVPLDRVATQNDITGALAASGVTPAQVTIAAYDASTQGSFRLAIRYYASAPVRWLSSARELSYDSPELCLVQRDETNKVLGAQGIRLLGAYCTWDPLLFRADLNLLAPPDSPWFVPGTAPDTYASFADCDRDRSRALAFQKELGKPVFGALCDMRFKDGHTMTRMRLLAPCETAGWPECYHRPPELPLQ